MGFISRLFENQKGRTQKMKGVAAEMSMAFTELNDTGLHQQLSEFKLFKKGLHRKIRNLMMESLIDSECMIFDYEYVISSGHARRCFKQTVFFINSKSLSLPQFYQKPETIFTKLLALAGMQDINFENFPDYSGKNYLKGEYEEVIRYYFSKDVLELLTNHKDLYVEGMNYYLILYQHDKLCTPSQIKAFKDLGSMLYKMFLLRSDASRNDSY
jgi:hypothetical protein